MLRDKLTRRLEAPGPGETARVPWPGVWAAFVVVYKTGNRGCTGWPWRILRH